MRTANVPPRLITSRWQTGLVCHVTPDTNKLGQHYESTTMQDSEMKSVQITRTGEPPLRFTGIKIGSSGNATGAGRSVKVWIYRTKGGKYVAHVGYRTCWQGEHDTDNAQSFTTPAELIEWLMADNGGSLGHTSQEACEEAAKNDEAFSKAFVEEVE